jgi:hypothetical protein
MRHSTIFHIISLTVLLVVSQSGYSQNNIVTNTYYWGQIKLQKISATDIKAYATKDNLFVFDHREPNSIFLHKKSAGIAQDYLRKWKKIGIQMPKDFQHIAPDNFVLNDSICIFAFKNKYLLIFGKEKASYQYRRAIQVPEGFDKFSLTENILLISTFAEAFAGSDNHYIKIMALDGTQGNKVYLDSRYNPFGFFYIGTDNAINASNIYAILPQGDSILRYSIDLRRSEYLPLRGFVQSTPLRSELLDSLGIYERNRDLNRISGLLFKHFDSITINASLLTINDSTLCLFRYDAGFSNLKMLVLSIEGGQIRVAQTIKYSYQNRDFINSHNDLLFFDLKKAQKISDNRYFQTVVGCKHKMNISYAEYEKSCEKEFDNDIEYLSFYEYSFKF